MNKGQKYIRSIALNNGGQTFKVSPEYNKTLDDKGRLTASSFLSRSIPIGFQKRKSIKAKVGAP